jgi:NAD(P)-dependent dehydrogenase (short-subunit alcohol dehydrogenase family)
VAPADRARAELGELDLLFVNAGITRSASLAETDEAVYDEVFATNTKGAYFTVQALAPLIVDGGAVVMSTSVATSRACP